MHADRRPNICTLQHPERITAEANQPQMTWELELLFSSDKSEASEVLPDYRGPLET
jgi:hypothetical protein